LQSSLLSFVFQDEAVVRQYGSDLFFSGIRVQGSQGLVSLLVPPAH
jgi:hypothetical protein